MHGGHQVAQKCTSVTGARRDPSVAARPPASSRKPAGAAVVLSPPRGQTSTPSPSRVIAAAIARAWRPRLGEGAAAAAGPAASSEWVGGGGVVELGGAGAECAAA